MNRVLPLENGIFQGATSLPVRCWFRFLSRLFWAIGNLAPSRICSSLFLRNKSSWVQPERTQGWVFVPHSFLRNEYPAGIVVCWIRNRKVPARLAGRLLERMDFGCQSMCSSSHFFPMGGMTHYFAKSVCTLWQTLHAGSMCARIPFVRNTITQAPESGRPPLFFV